MALLSFDIEANRRVFKNPLRSFSKFLPGSFEGGFTGEGPGPRKREKRFREAIAREVSTAFPATPRGILPQRPDPSLGVLQSSYKIAVTTQALLQRSFTISRRYYNAALPAIGRTDAHHKRIETGQREIIASNKRQERFMKDQTKALEYLVRTSRGAGRRGPGAAPGVPSFPSLSPAVLPGVFSSAIGGVKSIVGAGFGALDSLGGIFGKWLPLLGLARGIGSAIGKFKSGDTLGGIIESGAGIASITKGLGPLVGHGIHAIGTLIPETFRKAFNEQSGPIISIIGENIKKGFISIFGQDTWDSLKKSLESPVVSILTKSFIGTLEHFGGFIDEALFGEGKGKNKQLLTRISEGLDTHFFKPLFAGVEDLITKIPDIIAEGFRKKYPTLSRFIDTSAHIIGGAYTGAGIITGRTQKEEAAKQKALMDQQRPVDTYQNLKLHLQRYGGFQKFGGGFGVVEKAPVSIKEFQDAAIKMLEERMAGLDPLKDQETFMRLREKIKSVRAGSDVLSGKPIFDTLENAIAYIEKDLPSLHDPGRQKDVKFVPVPKAGMPVTPQKSPMATEGDLYVRANETPPAPVQGSAFQLPEGIGALSAHYESRNNPAAISRPRAEDPRKNYGAWQINAMNIPAFLETLSRSRPDLASQLEQSGPVESASFDKKWIELAKQTFSAQREYIQKEFYEPRAKVFKQTLGIDPSISPRGIQEAIWSTLQHGMTGYKKILEQTRKMLPENPNFEQVIQTLYKARAQYYPADTKRYEEESRRAIGLSSLNDLGLKVPLQKLGTVVEKTGDVLKSALEKIPDVFASAKDFLTGLHPSLLEGIQPLFDKISSALGPESFIGNIFSGNVGEAFGIPKEYSSGILADLSAMKNQIVSSFHEQTGMVADIFKQNYGTAATPNPGMLHGLREEFPQVQDRVVSSFHEQTQMIADTFRQNYGTSPETQALLKYMEESTEYQRSMANQRGDEVSKTVLDVPRDMFFEALAALQQR